MEKNQLRPLMIIYTEANRFSLEYHMFPNYNGCRIAN